MKLQPCIILKVFLNVRHLKIKNFAHLKYFKTASIFLNSSGFELTTIPRDCSLYMPQAGTEEKC